MVCQFLGNASQEFTFLVAFLPLCSPSIKIDTPKFLALLSLWNTYTMICEILVRNLSSYWRLTPITFKTNNWLADNFTKTCHLNELYTWACDTVMWHGSADTLFDSCQLTIKWVSIRMCSIKLNTDCICLGHLASNAQPLQENSQSECTYYCSHIIKGFSIY